MKILFFSDLHNQSAQLEKLLAKKEAKEAQWIVQCGDLFDDYTPNATLHAQVLAQLLNAHPAQKLSVCGNNDPKEKLKLLTHSVPATFAEVKINNLSITITHGHLGHANSFAHHQSLCNLWVEGHSHVASLKMINKHTLHFNPGSLSYSRSNMPTSYAILENKNLLIKTLNDEQVLFSHTFDS